MPMPMRHLELWVLESFAVARLRPEEMIRVGRHLSTCSACRRRLRREVRNGGAILQRLHLEDQRGSTLAEYDDLFERISVKTLDRFQHLQKDRSSVPQLLQEILELSDRDRLTAAQHESRFCTAAFVEGLLEAARKTWSDEPYRAESLSHLALLIADRLDRQSYSDGLVNDLKARAWAFVANARRIQSDFRGAEDAFHEAEDVLGEGSGDPLEWARLLDLKASLRRAQRRFGDALGLLDEVIAICRKTREHHLEGRALISKALIHDYASEPAEAVPLLFDALAKIDRQQEPRLLFTILQNLTLSLVALGEFDQAATVLPQARQAASELGTADDMTRTLWVEGLLDLGTQRFSDAEGKLWSVRDRYVEMGIGYNAALVSLDLAKIYLMQGRTAETKRLAAEMHPIFVSRDVQREAIAALLVFQQAAERESASLRLVDEVIRSVRRAQAGPAPRPERPT
jgi:tetratricopeptide (TPR) repeat protein